MNQGALGTCAVIGMGLIGGSFAAAVRKADLCTEIIGVDTCAESLKYAHRQGIIDRGLQAPGPELGRMDHIFLATPVKTFYGIFESLRQHCTDRTLIVDFGSVKGELAAHLYVNSPQLRYLPAHPIAGAERSGIRAADAELFRGRKFILTPFEPERQATDLESMQDCLRQIGALPIQLDPIEHDRVFAAVSHLPHMVAYTLVNAIADMEQAWGIPLGNFPGAGFRDFTRIASSDETMWSDIALTNTQPILRSLEHFEESLRCLRKAIERGDTRRLLEYFRQSREYRDSMIDRMNAMEQTLAEETHR